MEEKRRDPTTTPPPSSAAKEAAAPASEQPTSRRRGGGKKRKSTSLNSGGGGSNSETTSSKRQAREKPPVVPFAPIHSYGPCTRARVQPSTSYGFLTEAEVAAVKSDAEVREAAVAAAKAEEKSVLIENWEALEAKIESEYEGIRSRGAGVHVVPVHAGWFSWTEIHPLEKQMLPSFFSGKVENRTPEIYMEMRNWIMKKFHLNPSVQIELDQLSELTVGELDSRQEVMEFLDYWGLINYHPFPQNEPVAMSIDADESGKTASLVEKLFKFETVESWSPVVPRMNASVSTVSSGLFPESVVADELVKAEEPAVDYHCNSCSADCSRKRYHCQKQADFDLCAECFNNGKFGSDMSPTDFILMEPAEAGGASGGKWTDQETLLLLEAIEIFKDNWSEIAEHVATKTKSQCILHFVQMPIQDAFFNHDIEINSAPKENGLPDSVSTEDLASKEDQERDNALKEDPDLMESQGDATEKDASCAMEISKPDDVKESDESHAVGDSFALKALKEAFEAVSGPPLPGERLSFAEAGNPVMTLAAFLVRLVEPNVATASVRSLLKSLSSCHSGEQLAARHCFHLEDPSDDKKNLEGATTEKIELESPKHENENVEKQSEVKPDSVTGSVSLQDEDKDKNIDSAPEEHNEKKDSSSEEQKHVASPSSECAEKSDAVKEPVDMVTHEAQPASMNAPRNSDITEEKTLSNTEKLVVLTSNSELLPNSGKDSEDGASNGSHSQSKEPQEMIPSSEKKENELLVVSSSTTEGEKESGDTKAKECLKEKETLTTKNHLETKLRRAAVAAISAAAVKSKLLADSEEDQIRQLATLLIEKQLLKLETKLAFFNDMENVVMRAKEQLDRSKQRLFHERAQIIATRFGMSASARPTTQSLPPNKASASFPNSASRSISGINSLRPPISRPLMTPNFAHTGAAGSSMQPNADNFSSVGTK